VVSSNHQDRPPSLCLIRPSSWKFRTLRFHKLDHPVLLNRIQQNRFLHSVLAENRTIRFGNPDPPVFLENRILLDLIESLMPAAPFIPGNMLHSKIIEKSNNFQAFIKIGI
jgi:hypothetical protein